METIITRIDNGGTLWTDTDFKRKGGKTVKVQVSFATTYTYATQCTYYYYYISTKEFNCRKFHKKCSGDNNNKDEYLKYLSEDELHIAFYNHWIKLNPIKQFASKNSIKYGSESILDAYCKKTWNNDNKSIKIK